MEPDNKEWLMQRREKESNYNMRTGGLHINYKDVIKIKARTSRCVISVLSAGVRDRGVAVSMTEKWWFRAISHQGTKTKCKGETGQQISLPLTREKPLLYFSVTGLFPLSTCKSRQSEIRKQKTCYELLEHKHRWQKTIISLHWTVPSWRCLLSFSFTTQAKHLNNTEEAVLKPSNRNLKTISIKLKDSEQNSWEGKTKGSKRKK